jgi:hypothetical protein
MHAVLGLQVAEGVVALDAQRGALDAGRVAAELVGDLDLPALTLAVPQVHAQQHLGPVLALGAAGAGVDRDEGSGTVVFAAHHALELHLLERALRRGECTFGLGEELSSDGSSTYISRKTPGVVDPGADLGHGRSSWVFISLRSRSRSWAFSWSDQNSGCALRWSSSPTRSILRSASKKPPQLEEPIAALVDARVELAGVARHGTLLSGFEGRRYTRRAGDGQYTVKLRPKFNTLNAAAS